MHIYLDEHDRRAVIALKGQVDETNETAEKIVGLKGARFGKINLVATESA